MGLTDSDARFIDQCLKSINGLFDELIFVDTQSSKQPLDAITSAGGQIYVHPWADDYSLHRNQSLSYVSPDIDWVFIIDPDEAMFGDIQGFRDYLAALPESVHAVSVPLNDIQAGDKVMTFNAPRCFRAGKVEFKFVKHNTPYINGKSVICSDKIYMEHYGYALEPHEMAAKDERTERLLIKRLNIDPNDHAAHFYLAQHYGGSQQYARALKHIETYINRKDDVPAFNSSAYFTGYGLAMAEGDQQKAAQFIESGLKHAPMDIDLNWALVEFGEIIGNTEMIYNGANTYLQAYDRYQSDTTAQAERFVFRADPVRYARCLYHVGVMSAQMARNTLKKLSAHVKDNSDNETCREIMGDAVKNLGVLKVKIEGVK